MKNILFKLRKELVASSDEQTRKSSERFFKEAVKCYGIRSGIVVKIGKEHFKKIKQLSKSEIFEMCEELLKSGILEESFVACNWSYQLNKQYDESDFVIFESWVNKYVSNWATCDTLCNHTVGDLVTMYPKDIEKLKKWAKSKNMWVRRASAVSLIVPARRGEFLKDVFEIADILLLDKEDLVQKGYGWLLKVASNKHEKEVFNYVMKNKAVMPRTALRYAIEKMPLELKKKAMI